MVTIELFGVPRLRAGVEVVEVQATSLGEALRGLAEACPALRTTVVDEGVLRPFYLVAVNGAQLTADPATPLADGDVVALVSADGGG